jgi:multiple RNA-binding domain-containing protein 1
MKLFGRFGSLSRLLLPPSRSIGLVDFVDPADARRAFKSLAYRRHQHVPLYLEWAPVGTIKVHDRSHRLYDD